MKVVILNGLLKFETEKKKIVDLIAKQLEDSEIYYQRMNMYDWELPMYCGEANAVIDKIFNEFLSADAIIFVSSVSFGNISINLKNVFDYFQISKYRVALKNKPVIPVVIHSDANYINAYEIMLNFIKELDMDEYNKIILNVPNVVNDEYVDKTFEYIKRNMYTLCLKLSPSKISNSITNDKLNEILEKEEKAVDENQLKLELDNDAESDIKNITNMVNEKLSVRQIVNQNEKNEFEDNKTNEESNELFQQEKTVNEIASKYKSKIEEIMQLTLGDEEDNSDVNDNEIEEKSESINDTIDSEKIENNANIEKIQKEQEKEIPKEETKEENKIEIQKQNDIQSETQKSFPKITISQNLSIEEQSKEYIRNIVLKRNEMTQKKQEAIEKQMLENSKVETPKQLENSVAKTSSDLIREKIEKEYKIEKENSNSEKIVNNTQINDEQQDKNQVEQKESQETIVEVSKFKFNNFTEEHEVIPYEDNENELLENINASLQEKDKLRDMTKNLIYLFKAPENEKLNFMTQLNISGEEQMNLYFNIVDNKCSVFDGINTNSSLTIDVTSDKWRKILSGDVTLQNAFMTGMIKVTGNFMMLSKLDKALFSFK